MLLFPAEVDVNSLDNVNNWFAPMLLTVDPAGIIAVWMKWERANDVKAGRRWAEGDSVSFVVLRMFPSEYCWCFIEWKLSSFGVVDPSGQWTCCFLSEFVREKAGLMLFSDPTHPSSLPDSI